eukprot:snap_masked-scaffold_11-processed-gene-10.42-mRNA-1 protein AED:1.00 eAED:1.00 QI:0/0/0/0/1/1/2/0/61
MFIQIHIRIYRCDSYKIHIYMFFFIMNQDGNTYMVQLREMQERICKLYKKSKDFIPLGLDS